jgi:hypothetical protein
MVNKIGVCVLRHDGTLVGAKLHNLKVDLSPIECLGMPFAGDCDSPDLRSLHIFKTNVQYHRGFRAG